jgi:membrane protein involved in colicin uptake
MKIKFLQPTQHDADSYGIGDKADLPPDAAKALIAIGHAELNNPAALKAEAKAQEEAAAKAEAESKANAEAAAKAQEEASKS